MPKQHLRTIDVARAVNVHPNTVRLYEEWGHLPPVPRGPNGYRLYTAAHVDQMRLARAALQWPYPGGKDPVIRLVKSAAQKKYPQAMESAYQFLSSVRAEQAHADAAAAFLERWASGQASDTTPRPLHIGAAASRLGVTTDMLRNWERSGLLHVPRHPRNGYRLYAAADIGRARIIRVLRQAGYSVMAILRMLLAFDTAPREGLLRSGASLRQLLDTPRPDEDVYHVTDRWLSTLAEVEQRALDVIQLLEAMTKKDQLRR